MVSADRSLRGELYPGTAAAARQAAYGAKFGELTIIGFSRRSDPAVACQLSDTTRVIPTRSRSRFSYVRDAVRIARNLDSFDVVTAQDPFETGFAAFLIARMKGAPLHAQVHTDFFSPGYADHSLLNRIRIRMAGFVLRRATRIRVVSENIKSGIEKKYHPRAPITALPIFIDVAKFRNAQPSAELAERFSKFKTKLLVVSRLEPEKNVELAMRAFAQSSPYDACLIVVGEGSERERLQAVSRKLHSDDRIFFEGEREAALYYKIADLVLVASRYEGYGMVTIEALASGVPVLSTDAGIARDAGAIVSSEQRFAGDLRKWFENGPRTAELKTYPYENFDSYVRAYCDDIAACVKA